MGGVIKVVSGRAGGLMIGLRGLLGVGVWSLMIELKGCGVGCCGRT